MNKEVMILTGAGQIGMAIARRMGYGKKIVVGDRNLKSAEAVCRTLNEAGFDAIPIEMDLSSRESILNLIAVARKHGEISTLVNAAGVSPSSTGHEVIFTKTCSPNARQDTPEPRTRLPMLPNYL